MDSYIRSQKQDRHDYGNVDLSIVFDTLKDDIPELLILLDEELS